MNNADMPFVSIIMPIRNEEKYIEKSLTSLLNQNYPSDKCEIIISDGMSNDNTRKIISQIIQKKLNHPEVIIIENEKRIMPAGANLAVTRAKGEVIILAGGHTVFAFEYLKNCVTIMQKTKAECVGGYMITIGENWIARIIARALSSPFGVGGVAFRTSRNYGCFVDTVAYGAYRREVFDKIGLFDEELVRNQDDEFNFRLTQAGCKIWFDPSIKSCYHSRSSLLNLWKQYFQYGLYKIRVMQKRGALPSWRHIVPGSFVAGLILTVILSIISKEPLFLSIVAGPYIIANLYASILTARNDWKMLPFLPITFFILHFSYGLGFLWGFWRWRKFFFHGKVG